MRALATPSGTGNVVDIFMPGKIKSIALVAGEPLAFPPLADFPKGGAFFIRIPAGSDVKIQAVDGGDAYPLDGLAHWPLAFASAEAVELISTAGATVVVMQNTEASVKTATEIWP